MYIRNNFIKWVERTNYLLLTALIFCAYFMCMTGLMLISHHLMSWHSDPSPLPGIKRMAIIVVVGYIILTPIFSCAGVCIVRRRETPNVLLCAWAAWLLFIIIIPLLSESLLYLSIDSISVEDLTTLCNKDMDQVLAEHGRFDRALYSMASRFDLWSE